MTREEIFEAINAERDRQDAKFGEQNHRMDMWMCIIGEEYGEAQECVVRLLGGEGGKTWSDFEKEMIQTIAVSVSALESYYRQKAGG